MGALGGARHVTNFDGRFVLKGHSAMFVPVARYDSSIQWHLIQRNENDYIPYREIGISSPSQSLLGTIDLQSFASSRTFLGWWNAAETHCGTASATYDKIGWSSAEPPRRSARYSGGELGFQTIVTGKLSFAMGAKDGRLHFSLGGPLERII